MGTDQPTSKQLWRPRFSLLTLVLGVVFVGACGGLWYRWEPWYLDEQASCHISMDPPPSFKKENWPSSFAPDRTRSVTCIDGTVRRFPMLSESDDNALFCFFREDYMPGIPRGFVDNDTLVFDAREIRRGNVPALPYVIFTRRRPEYWWGIAWLPEFWVALASGGALAIIALRRLRTRMAVKQEAA